jgi:hypothetical protein
VRDATAAIVEADEPALIAGWKRQDVRIVATADVVSGRVI